MSEQPIFEEDPNRPKQDDIIQTIMEELQLVNDQRLFFKAQARMMQRRAETAEAAQIELQARLDVLESDGRDG